MDDDIAALRAQSNRAIAAHDAARAVAPMLADLIVITSAGTLLQGRDAMERAFAGSMADPAFVKYERSPIAIVVNGDVAMERGHWLGLWRNRQAVGCYLVRWERKPEGWRIKAEHYVPAKDADACGLVDAP